MQWMFMLVGLLLGALSGESLTAATLGAVVGLALGQALVLHKLEARNRSLEAELKNFASRFAKGTEAISSRLTQLEKRASEADAAYAPAEAAVPTAPVEAPVAPVVAAGAELKLEPLSAPALAEVAETAAPQSLDLQFCLDEVQPLAASVVPEPVTPRAQFETVAARYTPSAIPGPVVRPEPVEPPLRQPNVLERAIDQAQAWLFGGNTVLRIGLLLLFLGLAFLLRYAAEGVVVPVEWRYAGVAASALALLGLGWWLRRRKPGYALLLQGTGIGVLYLTVFAALRLHPLLDPKLALVLLILVTLFSAILAIGQNAMGLAVAAALGGFAAPILTSTGSGNHVALFSYFLLLNSGILAIAWFKAWRLLNLVGFLGTFGIGFAWGMRSYTPELLGSTEPFLLAFFLMYVAIGLLFARRRLLQAEAAPDGSNRGELLRWSARQGDYLDATILFGPPLVGFGLQCAIVRHMEFAAAFSALGLGLFYMLLARMVAGRERVRLLMETCLALGAVFGTLAIPLGLDARWTSAAWAVEGAGIFWLGLRQGRPLARTFALLLQLGAALAFLGELRRGVDTLLTGAPLGALMLGVALLFVFSRLRACGEEQSRAWERRCQPLLACLGLAFLYLIAPLCFASQGTAISWALAGLATIFIALRVQSRSFLFSAFGVQLLAGVVFLLGLERGTGTAVFGAGWQGLLCASLIGLSLIAGMLLAARDEAVKADSALMRVLSMVLLIGLVFINLAVLFVLPWQTASMVWAASGLLIVWLSLLLAQRASFYFGLALQLVGGVAFLAASPQLFRGLSGEGLSPLAHGGFWTPAVLALAAMVAAWRLQKARREEAVALLSAEGLQRLSRLLLAWGVSWWALTAICEVLRFAEPSLQATLLLGVAAVSGLLWMLAAQRSQWMELALACGLLVPAATLILWFAWHPHYHPAADLGWLGWGALLIAHLLILRRLTELMPAAALRMVHIAGCWLVIGVLALELRYLLMMLSEQYSAWRWLGWAVLPSAYLWMVSGARSLGWPVRAYPREYRVLAAAPLALLMLVWFWVANIASDGGADPLSYLPLINPLEIGLLLVLLAVLRWVQGGLAELGFDSERAERGLWIVTGLSAFALLTAAVFRAVHQWADVPYRLDPLLASMLLQAGLSIIWTLLALVLMSWGHRRGSRQLWLIGAVLIGVVVAKLFFIELGNRGGLERIVSFIGVGVLLLIVGYFAPLPPREEASEPKQVNT
jgi:uncharacterized membrane protein